ncbi:hypothetical protein [Porphyromonas cangingivalis]|nr:hypothetical protein [Porphyromonas cangingivalis]
MNSYITSVYKYEHKDQGRSLFVTTAENMIEYLKKLKVVPSYQKENRVKVNKEK